MQLILIFLSFFALNAMADVKDCPKILTNGASQEVSLLLSEQYPLKSATDGESVFQTYERKTKSLDSNLKMMMVDLFESLKISYQVRKTIAYKISGTTQDGAEYLVKDKQIHLTKDGRKYTIKAFDMFNPGFQINDLKYEDRSATEFLGKPGEYDVEFARLQRLTDWKSKPAHYEAILDFAVSVPPYSKLKLGDIEFSSVRDFLAAREAYRLNQYFGLLPLSEMKLRLNRIRDQLAEQKLLWIGDGDYSIELAPQKRIAKLGEMGSWIKIDDANGEEYWLKVPPGENSLEIRGFKQYKNGGSKPTGKIRITSRGTEVIEAWAPINDRVVFSLLMTFKDLGF